MLKSQTCRICEITNESFGNDTLHCAKRRIDVSCLSGRESESRVNMPDVAKLFSGCVARGHSRPGSFRQVDACEPVQRDRRATRNRTGQGLLAARCCRDTARSMVKMQERLVEENRWILDRDLGPYDAVEVRLHAADTVIFLDFSLVRCARSSSIGDGTNCSRQHIREPRSRQIRNRGESWQ